MDNLQETTKKVETTSQQDNIGAKVTEKTTTKKQNVFTLVTNF